MEEWKVIDGFEGRYLISSEGRVYSNISQRYLNTSVMNSGYERVGIKYKGKTHNFLMHRLVAQYFCEGYERNLDVNHINVNRLDNRSSNLEWVTRKENIHDCMRRGTHSVKEAHKVAHLKRRKKVGQFSLQGNFIQEFESARLASKHVGCHENSLSSCCRGNFKTLFGYKWKYI